MDVVATHISLLDGVGASGIAALSFTHLRIVGITQHGLLAETKTVPV
jgi:hypothetical protein